MTGVAVAEDEHETSLRQLKMAAYGAAHGLDRHHWHVMFRADLIIAKDGGGFETASLWPGMPQVSVSVGPRQFLFYEASFLVYRDSDYKWPSLKVTSVRISQLYQSLRAMVDQTPCLFGFTDAAANLGERRCVHDCLNWLSSDINEHSDLYEVQRLKPREEPKMTYKDERGKVISEEEANRIIRGCQLSSS